MPVRLRLDWIPGAEHAAYYVTKNLGYYAEAGPDVTIDDGSGSSDSAKLLGTGEIQFGWWTGPLPMRTDWHRTGGTSFYAAVSH